MADTGATYPGLGSNEDRAGLAAWSNPIAIQAVAGNAGWSGTDTYSDWLRGSDFGFSVPVDATILGVKLDMERLEVAGAVSNSLLYLVDNNGTNTGDSKHATHQLWVGVEEVSYGGATDLWGATLTPAIINSANFGARMSVGVIGASSCGVYWYKITVYYTEPPTTTILPATSITTSSARLNAEVLNDGGAACEGRFSWGKIETEDDFEWGADTDPLTDDGGGIDWSVTALGTSVAEISTTSPFAGTRCARLYRDGSNNVTANFPQSGITSSQVISWRVKKDDTADHLMYHGDGSSYIGVRIQTNELITYRDSTSWLSTGATVVAGDWYKLEVRNANWVAKTFDIYLDNVLIKSAADMNPAASFANIIRFDNIAGTANVYLDNVRVLANRTTTAFANGLTTDDPFYSDLTDLDSGTKHVYQAQTQNSEEGVWSSEATFKTVIEKLLSDTVAIADSIMKTASLNKADSVSVSDSVIKSMSLVKGDAVAVGDTIVKRISLIKADTVPIADLFDRTMSYVLSLADNVGIMDSISKFISIARTDAVAITDSMVSRIGAVLTIILSDIVTITDHLVGELRTKAYLKQAIARMQIKRMAIARMPLFRWIIRRWTA